MGPVRVPRDVENVSPAEPASRAEASGRAHRYDSERQERLAQHILKKHEEALRELAK